MPATLRLITDALKDLRPVSVSSGTRSPSENRSHALSVGLGALLLGGLIAFIWANSPWNGSYLAAREAKLAAGMAEMPFVFSVQGLADMLMAVFFMWVGSGLRRRTAGKSWTALRESLHRPGLHTSLELGFAAIAAVVCGWIPAFVGLAIGAAIPARVAADSAATSEEADRLLDEYDAASDTGNADRCSTVMARLNDLSRKAESPADRLQRRTASILVFAILPLFGWAHAGVRLGAARGAVLSALALSFIAGVGLALQRGRSISHTDHS